MIYREKLGMPWRGASLIQEAAEKGHPEAQYQYGVMIESGEVSLNYDEAMSWYFKAAIQGHTQAHYSLANLYQFIKSDSKQAFFWYQKAAEKGHPDSQYQIGKFYLCKNNIELAIYWFKKARDHGHETAHAELMKIERMFFQEHLLFSEEHAEDLKPLFSILGLFY